MIRRLNRYLIYKFVTYIPGTGKLVSMEAKRLSQYIFDNYDSNQQIILLNEIKNNVIEMQENKIKNEELKLITSEINLKVLKTNFGKLQELK